MSQDVGIAEHLDRIRRVRTVKCPRCGQPPGKPCVTPAGATSSTHHAVRYTALYRRKGRKS